MAVDSLGPPDISSTLITSQRHSTSNYRAKSSEKQLKKSKKLLGNAHALDLKVLFDTYFKKPAISEKLYKRDSRNNQEPISRT